MAEEPEIGEDETPKPSDRVRMNVWIRRDLYEEVMKLVAAEDSSITDVVKVALRKHIKNKRSFT